MPEPAEHATAGDAAPSGAPEPPTATAAPARAGFDLKAYARENPRIIGAAALLILGVVFVMLGWYGAARTNILTEQIPYLISGGLLGLGLIIVAGFLVSSAINQQRSDEMHQDLLRALRMMPSSNGSHAAGTAGEVFALEAGHSYHLAGCPILEGKSGVRPMDVREAISGGLGMCKLCGPE